ncbi:MAG: hypothetical protein WCH75_06980 [Candidatus Binatia bacterium]
MTRSSLLSVLLVAAIGLILTNTYWLWVVGPWDLPNPGKAKVPTRVETSKGVTNPRATIGTESIVSKNIFDPERGAGFTREVEANSQAFQRIKSMVLLGTAILGNNRYAVLQDGAVASTAPGQSPAPMRVKLGDTVEGFKLAEVSEKRVVFARGAATVEVPLDYFRKIDIPQPRGQVSSPPGTKGQATLPPRVVTPRQSEVPVPRVIPALPRRQRAPIPPEPSPEQ